MSGSMAWVVRFQARVLRDPFEVRDELGRRGLQLTGADCAGRALPVVELEQFVVQYGGQLAAPALQLGAALPLDALGHELIEAEPVVVQLGLEVPVRARPREVGVAPLLPGPHQVDQPAGT